MDVKGLSDGPGGLWYIFTASATGSATVTTEGSAIDTVLSRYVKTECTGTSFTCAWNGFSDDVSATVKTSALTFDVTSGSDYTLVVNGKANARGNIVLNLKMTGSFSCTPACGTRQCGSNGCGGVCGTCASDKVCSIQSQ